MESMDWLASTAITALRKESKTDPSWISSKESMLKGLDRFEVLKWIVFDLDPQNLRICAKAIGVDNKDLLSVRKVLRKI